jgi:histidinol-phosphate aminotransferase
MKLKVPGYIDAISPYVPGKPIETLEREYGIANSIKLASNENPLGPSPIALKALRKAIDNLHRYPDGASFSLLDRLSAHLNIPASQIVIGNGSDDLLGMLALALLQPGDETLIPASSFLMYDIVTQAAGAVPVNIPLKDMAIDLEATLAAVNDRTRMIFICNPNNPTGAMVTRSAMADFLDAVPEDVVVVIDEAYIDFVRSTECAMGQDYLDQERALVVLRTFSKAYGLAGLRIGYGLMPTRMAELLNRIRMPFNANSLAQVAASAALDDTGFLKKTIDLVHDGLDFLFAELEKRGLPTFPTQANFFLFDVGQDAKQVFDRMLYQGVIVRAMTSYGYPEYIRINVGLPEENQRFLDALDKVLAEK